VSRRGQSAPPRYHLVETPGGLKPPSVFVSQRQSGKPLHAKASLGVGVNNHAPIAQERTESPPRLNGSPGGASPSARRPSPRPWAADSLGREPRLERLEIGRLRKGEVNLTEPSVRMGSNPVGWSVL
jgi:hypothetical protein